MSFAAKASDPLSWDIASWFVAGLLSALALSLVLWVGARVLRQPLRRLPFVSRLYSPQFSVNDFVWATGPDQDQPDDDSDGSDQGNELGAGIAALIRQHVRSLPGDPRLDRPGELALVSFSALHPLESDADVVAEGTEGAVLGALMQVARRISPRERFELDGALMPPGDNGPGITLTLSRGKGQVVASTTLREQDFDPWRTEGQAGEPRSLVTLYYMLADIAAAWTQWHLVVQYTGGNRRVARVARLRYRDPLTFEDLKPRTDAERAFATLGTHDDQSYALYRAGLHWQRRNDWYRARALYLKAQARDPENILASFQRGVIEIFLNAPRDAVGPLKFAEEASDEPLDRERDSNRPRHEGYARSKPLWYQAAYNRLRARKYLLDEGREATAEFTADAFRLAQAHVKALVRLEARRRRRFRRRWASLDDLRVFLTHLEATTLIMLARAKLESFSETELEPAIAGAPERSEFLECLEERSATEIVGYVLSRHEITDRAHYNLACLFAAAPAKAAVMSRDAKRRCYERAIDELRSGLTPLPPPWLWEDRDLKTLLAAKRSDFLDVVARYGPPELLAAKPRDTPRLRVARLVSWFGALI